MLYKRQLICYIKDNFDIATPHSACRELRTTLDNATPHSACREH